MAEITREFLVHIADQARIALSDAELDHYEKILNETFASLDKIKEVNTDSVAPTTRGTANTSVLREDKPIKWDKREAALNNAPEHEDGHFKVPAIMD